jgi:PilZ domain
MESAAGQGVSPEQGVAVAALAGVDEPAAALLAECFRQFGISAVTIASQDISRLSRERFDAFVLPLDATAEPFLAAIRRSPENVHAVIYGLCGSVAQAIRFSSYGINAVFMQPVERHAAQRVVRTTHLMVLRALRRYVRVPLVSAVMLQTGTESVPASTVEISSGGMALRTKARLAVPQSVQATLHLPGSGEMAVRAVVCWVRRDEDMAGLRFEPDDERRPQIREWIEHYLGGD